MPKIKIFIICLLFFAYVLVTIYLATNTPKIKRISDKRIDSLFIIINTLKTQDSTLYILVSRVDSNGVATSRWIRAFSQEYPWIDSRIKEDEQEAQ